MREKTEKGRRGEVEEEEEEEDEEEEEQGCSEKPVEKSRRLQSERYDVMSAESMSNDKISDEQELIHDLSPGEGDVAEEEGNVGCVAGGYEGKTLKDKEKLLENKEMASNKTLTETKEDAACVRKPIVDIVRGMVKEVEDVKRSISRTSEESEGKKKTEDIMEAAQWTKIMKENREKAKQKLRVSVRRGGRLDEEPCIKAWGEQEEERLEEDVETLGIADMAEWTYRGEGNDNIVLGHTTKGEILRLRKTSPDQQTSRRDLLKRALKDVEFFREAALPHFGPLLTDGWRVVILTQETLTKLRQVLVGKRPAFRLCKEVNPHGVATLSVDAATAFVSRNQAFRPHLHSPPLLTFPYSRLLKPPCCIPSSTPHTCSMHSIKHAPPTSMAPLQPSVTSPSSNLSTNQSPKVPTTSSSDQSNLLTETHRATHPLVVAMAMHGVCVEVKPKQGFPDVSTPDLPLCRFCLKQFEKVQEGARSDYCPCDLFSGNWGRMIRAMDALFSRPQNNLRVFQDGKQRDDVQSFRYLRDVILLALTHDFESTSSRMFGTSKLSSSSNLPSGSALGRCLLLQQMDTLGAVGAGRLYSEVCENMGTSKEELTQALTDFSNWPRRIGSITKDLDLNECKDFPTNLKKSQMLFEDTFQKEELPSKRKTTQGLEPPPKRKCSQPGWETVKLLQNYLVATTAKDCSFMVLLLGPFDKDPSLILCKPSEVNSVGHLEEDSPTCESFSTHSSPIPTAIPRAVSSPPSSFNLLTSATVTSSKAPTSQSSFSSISLSSALPSSQSTITLSSANMRSSSSILALPLPPFSFISSSSNGSVSPFSVEHKGQFYLCQVTAVDLVAKSPSKIPKHEKDYLRRKQNLLHLRACGQQPRCCT